MTGCAICRNPMAPFMSFGRMPVANGFLSRDEAANEPLFELAIGICDRCAMVQLTETIPRERMFHENYAFHSSTSVRMAGHFERFAEAVTHTYLASPDPLVVEMGSNDGILLHHFARAGIRHLGIEPSANVAAVARAKGVNTICAFFDEALAEKIVGEHGHADAFLAANVMCHIPYIHSVIDGICRLLKPHGVLIFEDPYLGDILQKAAYDQIYDEHAFYFSVSSLDKLFAEHDMEIVDVTAQRVHGGSMRYTVARVGAHSVSSAVTNQREIEKRLELANPEIFDEFRRKVDRSRDRLTSLLHDLKARNKRVAGYGATSKSTTVTTYCGITPDLLEFISDTTPTKQGKLSPGAHIPVRPRDYFLAHPPDFALLFAWNHADEIMAKERQFTMDGGKWIVYVPDVAVIE